MDEDSLIDRIGAGLTELHKLFGEASKRNLLVLKSKNVDLKKFPLENIPAIGRKLSEIQGHLHAYISLEPSEDITKYLKIIEQNILGLKSILLMVWHNLKDHASPNMKTPEGHRYRVNDENLRHMLTQKNITFTDKQLRERIFADFFGSGHQDTLTDLHRKLSDFANNITKAVSEIENIERKNAAHAERWIKDLQHAA